MAFVAIAAEELLCRICYNYLDDPIQLTCGDTFCRKCVDKLQLVEKKAIVMRRFGVNYNHSLGSLTCPVCSEMFDGNISEIRTNTQLRGMVEEFKTTRITCARCEPSRNSSAVSYCEKCDEFICHSCQDRHNWRWRDTIHFHKIISVHDIRAGKVVIRQKCRDHGESLDYICKTCKRGICFRCRNECEKTKYENLDQAPSRSAWSMIFWPVRANRKTETLLHEVVDEEKYTRDVKERIRVMEQKTDNKTSRISKHLNYLNEQKERVKEAIFACKGNIEKAHNEAVAKLAEGKKALIQMCNAHESALLKKLSELEGRDNKLNSLLNDARELIGHGIKVLGTGHMIETHDALCDRLTDLLKEINLDYSDATAITRHGEQLQFNKKLVELGEVQVVEWKSQADVTLSEKDRMNSVAPTFDGRMAVGYSTGGMDMYTADGKLEQTVLKKVYIREVAFMSRGRCAVRDCDGQLFLYSSDWKKRNVSFETLSEDEGGHGGLTVDCDDQIYFGYRKAKKIQVFTASGGKPIREISCGGYMIMQASFMEPNKLLVVKRHNNAVGLYDQKGNEKHYLRENPGYCIHSVVSKNGTILIAHINKDGDRVSIKEYTSELKYMRTLITDHVIEKNVREWYYLREFSSGEIAFCTSDKLYIFHKNVSSPET